MNAATEVADKLKSEIPRLCGYEVVRKPEFAVDWIEVAGRKRYFPPAKLQHTTYPGSQRMDWVEIIEPYYEKTAPQHIREIFRRVIDSSGDRTGFMLAYDIEDAKALLTYSNRQNNHNEIIAIYSNLLHQIKDVPPIPKSRVKFLGYDYFILGHGSTLESGLYREFEHFAKWEEYLNPFGLFQDASVIEAYCQDYFRLAKLEVVEDIGDEDSAYQYLDAILIGIPLE